MSRTRGTLQALGTAEEARQPLGPHAHEGSQESGLRVGPTRPGVVPQPGKPLDLSAWALLSPSWAGTRESSCWVQGLEAMASEPALPSSYPAQCHTGFPSAPWGQITPQSAMKQGLVLLTNVPSGDTLAQPPHSGLATNLLVCHPWPRAPGNRHQVPGSVERALHPGWPRGGRRQDRKLALKEEGQAEPKPTLAETGPGGSVQREGAGGPPALARGSAGGRWQQRPGNLGDDIGACGQPGV